MKDRNNKNHEKKSFTMKKFSPIKKETIPAEEIIPMNKIIPMNEIKKDLDSSFFKKNTSTEMKIYGINAVESVFKHRPSDIIRLYLLENYIQNFHKIVKYCVDNKLPYRLVTNEELSKVTESTHHEGICLLIKKAKLFSLEEYMQQINSVKPLCIVALDEVKNPHNLGAILRVCANFGVDAVLMTEAAIAQTSSSYRVSEGGAEWLSIISSTNLLLDLEKLKKQNFKIYTTSSHGHGQSVFKEEFSKKLVLFFGSESDGLSKDILAKGDCLLKIPSSGNIESLNVACAASVILGLRFANIKPN